MQRRVRGRDKGSGVSYFARLLEHHTSLTASSILPVIRLCVLGGKGVACSDAKVLKREGSKDWENIQFLYIIRLL